MNGFLNVRTRIANATPHYGLDGVLVYPTKNRIYGIDDLANLCPYLI